MITTLYASILALIFVGLTFYVIFGRLKFKVALGAGENTELSKRIRIHGNFAESVPLAVIIMFLAEAQNVGGGFIHVMGVALLLGRLLHIWGLQEITKTTPGRVIGTALTQLVLLGGAVLCLWHYFS